MDALLRLKTPTHNGTDIPFEATIDADKKVITIDPSDNFEYAQTIWVGIGESVEDSLNNTIFSAAAYFVTTDTNRAPVINTYTDQTTIEDVAINLVLAATDLDNDLISFAATSSEQNVTPQITDSPMPTHIVCAYSKLFDGMIVITFLSASIVASNGISVPLWIGVFNRKRASTLVLVISLLLT